MAIEKIENSTERAANKTFFEGVRSLENRIKDRGFLGMRGSSPEHDLMVRKFDELNYVSAQLVNATPSEREKIEKQRLKAMQEAREAANQYMESKLKEKHVESISEWSGSRMGRNRLEGAADLIDMIDQEMQRLNQKNVTRQDADIDRPAVPQENQQFVRTEPQDMMQDVPQNNAPQNAPELEEQAPAEGGEQEMSEEEKRLQELHELQKKAQESEHEKDMMEIQPDPENPFDMDAWAVKLSSLPDEKPGDPDLAEQVARETAKCMSAIMINAQALQNEETLSDEQFRDKLQGLMNEGFEEFGGAFANVWDELVENKAKALGEYGQYKQYMQGMEEPSQNAPEMEERSQDAPEMNDLDLTVPSQETIEPEKNDLDLTAPAQETTEPEVGAAEPEKRPAGIPENYLDPQTYVDIMKEHDIKQNNMPYEFAKTGVLTMAGMMIAAKICQEKGETPDAVDFNNSAVDVLESREFKDIVNSVGGTGWPGLEKMQDLVLDGGNNLYAKFAQNRKHNLEEQKLQEEIKERAMADRELQNTKNLTNDRVLGS